MASGSTTVHDLPYPLNSDAPNVATDIQALAQALANSLTSPVAVGASATLSDGELAVSTASPITLTLPSAAANVTCGVFAKVATAANPVTVSAAGGALIYGVGLNGVSSLTLGAVGAFVVLQSDGTNWFVVAGQQDTGWVSLTLASPWSTQTGFYSPAARLRGDTVSLRGVITPSSNTSTSPATLPTGMHPASDVQVVASPGLATGIYITTGGVITLGALINAATLVALDSTVYPLS